MPEDVSARLRCGLPLEDADFDRLYPSWAQRLSGVHWTPVDVARQAAEILIVRPGMRVLDVGAGVGKFCLVGALAMPGVFYGIEQRSRLVSVARRTAGALGLTNVHFLHGNMLHLEWYGFDGYYFFNPFAENLFDERDAIDASVDRTVELYRAYILGVRARLGCLPCGTRVVTYHGFGYDPPTDYRLELEKRCGNGRLQLWIKRS